MTTLRPSRAPGIRGLLSSSSVAELLVFALEQRLHGSFVFETPAGEKSALFLTNGCVTKARTADSVEPLGRLFLEDHLVDPDTLDSALARAGVTGRRLGEVLVDLAAVTPQQVEAALNEQLGRRVSLLGRLPGSSAYGFYTDSDFLGSSPVCDADPLALIWRSLRDAAALTFGQTQDIVSLGGRTLRLHPASAPERLGLSQPEQMVVNALRTRPRSLDELLRAALLDGERLRRLMYALLLTHQLDQGDRAQPLDAAANLRRSSRPPLGSRSSVAPRSSGIPESQAPRARSSLRPASSGERRRESTGSLHPTDPVQLERARASFDAAREQVMRQQFEAAEKLAREACAKDPGNAEYLALHAWLRAQLGALQHPDQAAQIVAALDRALLKERESVAIHFYRGQVLNRLGREEEAMRDFRFILRREPGHVDAARELRLHQMRKRGSEKRPSLLAKLFLR